MTLRQWSEADANDNTRFKGYVSRLPRYGLDRRRLARMAGICFTADNGEHAGASVACHRYRRSSCHPKQSQYLPKSTNQVHSDMGILNLKEIRG
jgi:hypothetical protein